MHGRTVPAGPMCRPNLPSACAGPSPGLMFCSDKARTAKAVTDENRLPVRLRRRQRSGVRAPSTVVHGEYETRSRVRRIPLAMGTPPELQDDHFSRPKSRLRHLDGSPLNGIKCASTEPIFRYRNPPVRVACRVVGDAMHKACETFGAMSYSSGIGDKASPPPQTDRFCWNNQFPVAGRYSHL